MPSLRQLWSTMDSQWSLYNCDPLNVDERVDLFYKDRVWLLNGIFGETDLQSSLYREAFKNWIIKQSPLRIADIGGGFGTLSRLIGLSLPNSIIEIVEPHPHQAALGLASETSNVSYVSQLTGEYDLIMAIDVFEHVPNPIALSAVTSEHLRIGCYYLMASCFRPVIHCHLPQLFHLSIGWSNIMKSMGLMPTERVSYGHAFIRLGSIDLDAALEKEKLIKEIFGFVKLLPLGRSFLAKPIIRVLSAFSLSS